METAGRPVAHPALPTVRCGPVPPRPTSDPRVESGVLLSQRQEGPHLGGDPSKREHFFNYRNGLRICESTPEGPLAPRPYCLWLSQACRARVRQPPPRWAAVAALAVGSVSTDRSRVTPSSQWPPRDQNGVAAAAIRRPRSPSSLSAAHSIEADRLGPADKRAAAPWPSLPRHPIPTCRRVPESSRLRCAQDGDAELVSRALARGGEILVTRGTGDTRHVGRDHTRIRHRRPANARTQRNRPVSRGGLHRLALSGTAVRRE